MGEPLTAPLLLAPLPTPPTPPTNPHTSPLLSARRRWRLLCCLLRLCLYRPSAKPHRRPAAKKKAPAAPRRLKKSPCPFGRMRADCRTGRRRHPRTRTACLSFSPKKTSRHASRRSGSQNMIFMIRQVSTIINLDQNRKLVTVSIVCPDGGEQRTYNVNDCVN